MVEFKGSTESSEKKSAGKYGSDIPIDMNASVHKEGILHKLGDAIEKVGDVIEHKVSHKLGEAIEKFGDRVEHMKDKK